VQATAPRVGMVNLIVNGDMRVAQRGTVATGGSTGLHYGGPDRWRMYQENTVAAYTLSQDTNVPTGEGFSSSFKIDVTTADATVDAADRVDFLYRFEGQELQQIAKGTANAKAMMLSFWVSSPKTGTHIVEFYDTDNSRQVSIPYTISVANTWEKKELAVPADTVGALDNDVNLSLQIGWWLLAGSNFTSGTLNTSWGSVTSANRVVGQVNVFDNTSNNFYLTGVQLEKGSTATDFEYVDYGRQLQMCQRYYQIIGETDGSVGAAGYMTGGTNIYNAYPYHTVMRAVPTGVYNMQAPSNGSVSFTLGSDSIRHIVTASGTGRTASAGATNAIRLSAEL
jgi:hypothetical protein